MKRQVSLRRQSSRPRTHYMEPDQHAHPSPIILSRLHPSAPRLTAIPQKSGGASSPLPAQSSLELHSLSFCPAEPVSPHRRRASPQSQVVCADYAFRPHHRPPVCQRHRFSADWSVADNARRCQYCPDVEMSVQYASIGRIVRDDNILVLKLNMQLSQNWAGYFLISCRIFCSGGIENGVL